MLCAKRLWAHAAQQFCCLAWVWMMAAECTCMPACTKDKVFSKTTRAASYIAHLTVELMSN